MVKLLFKVLPGTYGGSLLRTSSPPRTQSAVLWLLHKFHIYRCRFLHSAFHMIDQYGLAVNPSVGLWITSFAFALVWTHRWRNHSTSQAALPADEPARRVRAAPRSWSSVCVCVCGWMAVMRGQALHLRGPPVVRLWLPQHGAAVSIVAYLMS